MRSTRVDISYKTVLFIAAFIGALWIIFLIREVIILLFIAIIFMSALSPIVTYLERFKVPRALSIASTYIVVVGTLVGLISLMVTPLVDQTVTLAQSLPQTISHIFPQINQTVIQEQAASLSKNAFSIGLVVINNFIALISVAVLAFYLLMDRGKLDKVVTQFFPQYETRITSISKRIEDKLGSWVRGQVALSVIIGSLSYLALLILNIPNALPLAIFAGMMEVVPVIGPIVSAVPAVLIAYSISPVLALFVVLAYFIIQQLENHLVVPQVMKKAVGLNPLIVILAVAIGGKLLGILGALLAVPITVVVQIIIEEVFRSESK